MVVRPSHGFTLIELLVVISIISLLASIVLSSLQSSKKRAYDAARMQTIDEVRVALELYYAQYGHYPTGTAYSPWMLACPGDLNWKNCAALSHGDPIGDLVSASFLPGPLKGDPYSDCENCGGGSANYLGDKYPIDRGFVYCSNIPSKGNNCPVTPGDSGGRNYFLGTNLETSAGNITPADDPRWGNYQFHVP